MSGRTRRRHRILELLERQRITSQDQLQRLLAHEGIEATQATISRDLRDLGVFKGPGGYAVPRGLTVPVPPEGQLARAAADLLLSAETAGSLVVLRTGPGRAQALAHELDRATVRGVVGTVAGDDTIFVAAKSATDASRLVRDLRRLAGIGPGGRAS